MNKGFTLVELLAVIVILSLLAALASTSVTKIVKDSKSDLYDSELVSIKSAAEAWGASNPNKLPDTGYCKYITLKELKESGLLDESIINPKTNKEFDNDMVVKITNKKTVYDTPNIIYEVNSSDISSCISAMPICKLISDTDNSGTITMGDKYECKVKLKMEKGYENGYIFYVLTTPSETDTPITLIMDQNINSDGTPAGIIGVTQSTNASQYNLVAWNNESGKSTNAYGPITAMSFLYNATKNWINIEPLNYTYNDKIIQNTIAENTSYTSFESTNGVAVIKSLTGDGVTIGTSDYPLRARMPIYSNDTTITEILNKTNVSSYLYDNLDPEAKKAPYGYWSISSYVNDSDFAWRVRYAGYVDTGSIRSATGSGVRPVIQVDKTMLYE